MSENLESEFDHEEFEDAELDTEQEQDEYEYEEVDEIEEEISTVEVDRVLEIVVKLIESVESQTIQEYLEDAYNGIFQLVYEEDVDGNDAGNDAGTDVGTDMGNDASSDAGDDLLGGHSEAA